MQALDVRTEISVHAPLHFSDLRHMALSPAHYRARLSTPREQTSAMRFGSLVHAVLLGGHFEVFGGDRRGSLWKAFAEAHEGELVVTRDEYDRAVECARAVRASPVAAQWLGGQHEYAATWDLSGRPCATRGFDVVGNGFVAELKTSSCTEPGRFGRQCLRMGYHAQLAWYQEGIRAHGLAPCDDRAAIIGVEVAPPYAVTVLRLGPRCLEEGRRMWRLWFEQLRQCEESEQWPAYTQSEQLLEVEEAGAILIDGEEFPF